MKKDTTAVFDNLMLKPFPLRRHSHPKHHHLTSIKLLWRLGSKRVEVHWPKLSHPLHFTSLPLLSASNIPPPPPFPLRSPPLSRFPLTESSLLPLPPPPPRRGSPIYIGISANISSPISVESSSGTALLRQPHCRIFTSRYVKMKLCGECFTRWRVRNKGRFRLMFNVRGKSKEKKS